MDTYNGNLYREQGVRTNLFLNTESVLCVVKRGSGQIGKEGKKLDQEVAYKEAKIIVYHKEKKRWLKQHPSYNSEDNFYQLSM